MCAQTGMDSVFNCLIWTTVELIITIRMWRKLRMSVSEVFFLSPGKSLFIVWLTAPISSSMHKPWCSLTLLLLEDSSSLCQHSMRRISLWRSASVPRCAVMNWKWKIGPQSNNCSGYRVMRRTDLHQFCSYLRFKWLWYFLKLLKLFWEADTARTPLVQKP